MLASVRTSKYRATRLIPLTLFELLHSSTTNHSIPLISSEVPQDNYIAFSPRKGADGKQVFLLMSISRCPGTQLGVQISIPSISEFCDHSPPEARSAHDFEVSNAPCLGHFGIYLVNPQHRQCPAVYTSGRTSSFQQHRFAPLSDLSLYRSSGIHVYSHLLYRRHTGFAVLYSIPP